MFGCLVDTLLLQLLVIILTSRAFGLLFRKYLALPYVLGEMLAGIALGPSLLGAIFPALEQYIFPTSSLGTLYVMSQIGLILYMFMTGLTFRLDTVSGQKKEIVLMTVLGYLCPLIAGIALSQYLMSCSLLKSAPDNWNVVFFFSTVLTSTALPVLSRVLEELKIAGTRLGTRCMLVAAITDIIGCAFITITTAATNPPHAALMFLGMVALLSSLLMVFGKRIFAFFERWQKRDNGLSETTFAFVLCLLFACVLVAEQFKIQPVFTAFALGAVLPRGSFGEAICKKLHGVTVVLLLPIFLTFSGLNTKIWMLNSLPLVTITVCITAIACLSKIVGCATASKLSGEPWRVALGTGALMNSRGMIGLVILNLGFQLGLITQPLFTVLAIMDLVTTVIAPPLFLKFLGTSALVDLRTENVMNNAKKGRTGKLTLREHESSTC
jgi:Kef-type K+ transport system membrane component KefB